VRKVRRLVDVLHRQVDDLLHARHPRAVHGHETLVALGRADGVEKEDAVHAEERRPDRGRVEQVAGYGLRSRGQRLLRVACEHQDLHAARAKVPGNLRTDRARAAEN